MPVILAGKMIARKIIAAIACALFGAILLIFFNYLAIIPVMIMNYKVFSGIDGRAEERLYLNLGWFVFLNIAFVLIIYAALYMVNRSTMVEALASLSDYAITKTAFQRAIEEMDRIPLPFVRTTLMHTLILLAFAVSLPALFWNIGNYHAACSKIFLVSKTFTRQAIANVYLISGFLILLFLLLGFLGLGRTTGRHAVGSLGAYGSVMIWPSLLLALSSMWFCARLNSIRLDQEEAESEKVSQQPVE
ncbi:hypothetical protein ABVF61_12825 [Roseibium sp. HPY-6]|uniref:hypothetical protein n=1 Tax=Roseibium sp. HPY-6 TaxID=3229852 RepID=UPI00338D9519